MSGFEVAGVVLGAIPIVIGALEAYRAGKGQFATVTKAELLVGVLIHRLTDTYIQFNDMMLDLLRNAGIPDVFAEEVTPDDDKHIEILHDTQTGQTVKEHLGPRFPHFLQLLKYHEKYLKEIVNKLHRIIQLPDAAKVDLSVIVEASKSPDFLRAIKGKLKFAIDRKSIETLIESLKIEGESLRKIIDGAAKKQSRETRQPQSSSASLSSTYSRLRQSANSLYQAACKVWTCDKHQPHTLMLRLEDWVPESERRDAMCSPVAFRLCFSMEATEMQRIEVLATHSGVSMPSVVEENGTPSTALNDCLTVPVIMVTEAPNAAHPVSGTRTRINSICEGAWEAREKRRVLLLELTSCASLEVVDKDDSSPHSYDMSISLADFLKEMAINFKIQMKPLQQTLLALKVVSSMLQLRPTMWCRVPWNSSTIKFPLKSASGAKPVLHTPYVEQAIGNGLSATQGSNPTTKADWSIMLELAILLLEILHNTTIEAWAAENDEGDTDTNIKRMTVATNWKDASSGELLPHHLEAVAACLTMHARSQGSWDEDLQRFYVENVIRPLQEVNYPRRR